MTLFLLWAFANKSKSILEENIDQFISIVYTVTRIATIKIQYEIMLRWLLWLACSRGKNNFLFYTGSWTFWISSTLSFTPVSIFIVFASEWQCHCDAFGTSGWHNFNHLDDCWDSFGLHDGPQYVQATSHPISSAPVYRFGTDPRTRIYWPKCTSNHKTSYISSIEMNS